MPLDTDEGWAKCNLHYWRRDYRGFLEFFFAQQIPEPHSTKQIEDCVQWGLEGGAESLILADEEAPMPWASEEDARAMCERVRCPVLVIHGDLDNCQTRERASAVAELTGGTLVTMEGAGHLPQARHPVQVNGLLKEFADAVVPPAPKVKTWTRALSRRRRALYVSSPIGLGHARRDVAIAKELRKLHPDLEIDWLAQHPVTAVLEAEGERIHPASALLANESAHIESESAEHDLHAFQAIRRMDEILVANFMLFLDLVREENYDLWIGDEAWEVDYFLHENPELKSAAYVWLTDFVGWLPMDDGGEHETFLTTDYNAEMIEHIARFPRIRDRAVFVGNPDDVVPNSFGNGLPGIRDWTEQHYDFSGYVTGFEPVADREKLRAELGYGPREQVCIVTVGGSGVGGHLLRRVIEAFPQAKANVPELRMVVVAGPRIDPASLPQHDGLEIRAVRARALPPPRGVRPRRRPGRPDDLDGADRQRPPVPLLPAAPPLRAELPRPPPAGAVRRRTAHGLRDRRPGRDRGRDRRGDRPRGRLPAGRDRRRVARGGADRRAAVVVEPPRDGGRSAQPHVRIRGELGRIQPPPPRKVAKREEDDRVRAEEDVPQRLAVPVPQLLAPDDPRDRPPDEAREPDAPRQVEPHDDVGTLEDEIAELASIGAVDDPALRGEQRLHARPQLLRRRLRPVGAVVERVQLVERHVEPSRELTPQRRLPASARARDDDDAGHSMRASSGCSPSTPTR